MSALFSVILATRNRPELFADALNSVLEQTYHGFEIIIVDDGSDAQYANSYDALFNSVTAKRPDIKMQVLRLIHRAKGHGPNYTRNMGVTLASNDFICFLDDDDYWIAPHYLEKVAQTLANHPDTDLHMSNQKAWLFDQPLDQAVWLDNLPATFAQYPAEVIADTTYKISIENLMALDGFCHLNCLVMRRKLFNDIGGIDESICYEEDRDLYLRTIDHANKMIFNAAVVAHHRVPDKSKTTNVSTASLQLNKRLCQLRVFEKAVIYAKHPLISKMAKLQLVYTLKRIAKQLFKSGDYAAGSHFGWQALGARFSFKWLAYLLVQLLKNWQQKSAALFKTTCL